MSIRHPAFLAVAFVLAVFPLTAAEPKKPADEKAVREILDREIAVELDGHSVKDICQHLGEKFGLAVRIDSAALKRLQPEAAAAVAVEQQQVKEGPHASQIRSLYDTKIDIPLSRGMTVADVLTEICTQMPGKWSYRVRNTTVLIAPAFEPPAVPGGGVRSDVGPMIPTDRLTEQLLGESVNFKADNVPLTAALEDLRKRTGANIVLDKKAAENAKAEVTGTFNDARLLTVLQLLTDMAELKVVSMNNVFYITSPENADRLQAETNRELFGEPMPPAPPPPVPAEPAAPISIRR